MTEHEKILELLEGINNEIKDVDGKINAKMMALSEIVTATIEDVKKIPDFIATLSSAVEELEKENKELDEKLMNINKEIEEKSKISNEKSNEVQKMEKELSEKRTFQQELSQAIDNLSAKKADLEKQLVESTEQVKTSEINLTEKEKEVRRKMDDMEATIDDLKGKLDSAKESNKLIVYLMDSGLLDVPEAEIVSVIASADDGLLLSQIKEKVKLPSVRVQPTLNNLLDKVITFDEGTEKYKIMDVVKGEL